MYTLVQIIPADISMLSHRKQIRGFTLIETVVYIGLFAILIGGAVVAVYSIVEGNGRNQSKSLLQQEGDFLIAKINWAMAGAQAITAPPVGNVGTGLSVNKWTTALNPVVVALTGDNMTLSRAGSTPVVLNNPDITVSDVRFTHTYEGGSNPESVTATFTLSSLTPNGMSISGSFSTTNYIRR